MTDEEMIEELGSMRLPAGIRRTYPGHGFQVNAYDTSGNVLATLCEYGINGHAEYEYTNHVGEQLGTLYKKCKAYDDKICRIEKEKETRDFKRAIQLIKDL